MSQPTLLLKIAAIAAIAVSAIAIAVPPAEAQITFGIRFRTPPPRLRYEVRPSSPGPGFVWSEGYWEPNGGRYRWHGGQWSRPPFEGGAYTNPRWDHYPDGWHMQEGYWTHEGHENHYWESHPDNRGRDRHHDDR